MDSFCQKHVMFQLELCVMTLKDDAKFKGKLTCGLKNDLRNLVTFHASSGKSRNLHFDGSLLSKPYKELCLVTLKNDTKFKEKLTLGSKNGHEQFGEF